MQRIDATDKGGTDADRVAQMCGCDHETAVSLLVAYDGQVSDAIQYYLDMESEDDEYHNKQTRSNKSKRRRTCEQSRRQVDRINPAGRIPGPPPRPCRSDRPLSHLPHLPFRWDSWHLQSSPKWTADFAVDRGPPLKLSGDFCPGDLAWRGASAVLQYLSAAESDSRRWTPAQIQVQAQVSDVAAATGACDSQDCCHSYHTLAELRDDSMVSAYLQIFYGKDTARHVLGDLQFIPTCAQLKRTTKSLIVFVSRYPTFSGTHRDATPSILYCAWGCKTIWIAPPNIHEKWPTEFQTVPKHENWLSYDPFIGTRDRPDPEQFGWRRCTLIPGEAIFIPAGWWHNVWSPADTVGISADIATTSSSSLNDA